ncbi:MAG TPA: fasciclin domain-containing protein [Aquabacterium sp.]|uniref:fasciclin domain-containing protein n=1 Tax=Aquabacterium sp. TaxID=1872578 RepID=UPI002E368DE5|nr:fasciclin domain-containing protein [Aquabacterium sp.]HEX5372277.1 fasciclin domain-containing protein [Aquabacterium sp.]
MRTSVTAKPSRLNSWGLGSALIAAVFSVTAAPAHASGASLSAYVQCRNAAVTHFPGTIVDAAIATPELSTLVNLVVAADLVGPLSGKGPLTVFAPTNDAFAKVPAPLLSLIGSNTDLLTSVLTYHVTPGTVDPRRPLLPSQVKTLQGQSVFVGFDADGASVNQSVAACKGVKTTNGTVWIIDSVLLPQFK